MALLSGCAARLQQEHQEREFERKILEAAKEKEMREKQLEQEERLAKVCLTHEGWGGVERDKRSPFLELVRTSESGEKTYILSRREEGTISHKVMIGCLLLDQLNIIYLLRLNTIFNLHAVWSPWILHGVRQPRIGLTLLAGDSACT